MHRLADAPRAVIFDLDGTLADTAADICIALNAALALENLGPLDCRTVRLMIGRGPTLLAERALVQLEADTGARRVSDLADNFVRCYTEQANRESELFDGVLSCLESLSSAGIPAGVCSNKPHELCLSLLSDLGIAAHIGAVQGSIAGLPKKPDPAPLLRTLETLGVSPGHALYIGDSETDVRTARAAAVPVALVGHGYSDIPVEEIGADWVIGSLTELGEAASR